jgi:hypothetical protein
MEISTETELLGDEAEHVGDAERLLFQLAAALGRLAHDRNKRGGRVSPAGEPTPSNTLPARLDPKLAHIIEAMAAADVERDFHQAMKYRSVVGD